jgi:hypothetical protein
MLSGDNASNNHGKQNIKMCYADTKSVNFWLKAKSEQKVAITPSRWHQYDGICIHIASCRTLKRKKKILLKLLLFEKCQLFLETVLEERTFLYARHA